MQTTQCIRCGKTRIVVKTWTEKVGEAVTTYTLAACPDPECQKKVEELLEKKNNRVKELREQSNKRRANLHLKRTDLVLGPRAKYKS